MFFIRAQILKCFGKQIMSKRLCFCFKTYCSVYMVTNNNVSVCLVYCVIAEGRSRALRAFEVGRTVLVGCVVLTY